MTPLALTLVHALWEGAALAALASIAFALCTSAKARYAAGLATLALLLAAPVVTFLLLQAHRDAPLPVLSTYAPSLASLASLASPASLPSLVRDSLALDRAWPARGIHYGDCLVGAWLVGVLLLSLRSAGGVLAVRRLLRKGVAPLAPEIHDLCAGVQRRLGIARAVQYLESSRVHAPMAAGWIRPVVLLPVGTLAELAPTQREGVLAHELAHVRRFDTLVNLGQVVVEALLFYHPAAWWISRRIRVERENCCDDVAVVHCGDAFAYSHALTRMAERVMAPRMAMAANRSPLVARVARLLAERPAARSWELARLLTGAVGFVMALVAGIVFVGCLQTSKPPEAGAVLDDASSPRAARTSSYITSLQEAGLTTFTVDELLSLKIHGVTGEYIAQMRALGLEPTPEELVAMKIQDVSPGYVKRLQTHGMRPGCEEIVQLKVQGVSP
jgi:beta-lactamase regulating signal transducer with metallopeptidase domain